MFNCQSVLCIVGSAKVNQFMGYTYIYIYIYIYTYINDDWLGIKFGHIYGHLIMLDSTNHQYTMGYNGEIVG